MTFWNVIGILAAGFGAGLMQSTAGLASLVSYPALLAVGLPPVTANMTNTAGLSAFTIGAVASTQPELKGSWSRLWPRVLVFVIFGAVGSAVLMLSPAGSFEAIVPWLIAAASIVLMFRDRIQGYAQWTGRSFPSSGPIFFTVLAAIGLYGGYFGAAAGVLVLAWLMLCSDDSLAFCSAQRNVYLGAANISAMIWFAIFGDINWAAAGALACGGIVGAFIGPKLLRRAPEKPMRIIFGIIGLGLAVVLFIQSLD